MYCSFISSECENPVWKEKNWFGNSLKFISWKWLQLKKIKKYKKNKVLEISLSCDKPD